MIKNLLFFIGLIGCTHAFAQTTTQDYARIAEQQRRAQTLQQMDSAVLLMDNGKEIYFLLQKLSQNELGSILLTNSIAMS